MQCNTALCNVVQRGAVLCYAMLFSAAFGGDLVICGHHVLLKVATLLCGVEALQQSCDKVAWCHLANRSAFIFTPVCFSLVSSGRQYL